MYHSNSIIPSTITVSHSWAEISRLQLTGNSFEFYCEGTGRTDFDLGGQVGLLADSKKVSFLKIFPPSPQSSSWCSESTLVVRDLYLDLYSCRLKV